MATTIWEADKMLDVYIYDYLLKRELTKSAQTFHAEAKVSADPVAIDAPGGFLFEWWSVFWDVFIARTNDKHSEPATAYIETQLMKVREQQEQHQQMLQQQPLPPQQPQSQQQIQMQQQLLQRHAQQQQQLPPNQQQVQQQQLQQNQPQQQQLQQQLQQSQPQQPQLQQRQLQQHQRRDGGNLMNGPTNGFTGNDPLIRQSPTSTVNVLAAKMYEEKLKPQLQRDALDDTAIKQRLGENDGQLLDQNQASLLKSAAVTGQSSSQVLHGTAGGMTPQVQARSQQLPGSTLDMKTDINPLLTPRSGGPEGSLLGIPGSSQGGNNLTLKGWPLTGIDQLRPGLLPSQKPFMQPPQPFNQLQMLHQQQMLLAEQYLGSSSAIDDRRLRMMLGNRNTGLSKDGLPNAIGDIVSNVGSSLQAGGPLLSRGDTDMLMKLKLAQLQQQQLPQNSSPQQQQPQNNGPQLQQQSFPNQQTPGSSLNLPPHDKSGGAGGVVLDASMSNPFRANEQTGRKRKHPGSSSGPANSSGTANTAVPSPGSAPSTPSTHTPGDVMPAVPHGGTSKPLVMFGADGAGTLTSPTQLAELDRFVDDGGLDDNVESFLSHDEPDPRDAVGRMDIGKGFSFTEVNSVRASSSKVVCCHFSPDGKLLASGGHDKKAVLWSTDGLKLRSSLEEHTALITDVRFSPNKLRLATSSFDKTVRVWDVDNPAYSLRTFTGHNATVMSLDFHPNNDDLLCSCDGDGEIRFWSINNGSCPRNFKGATTQVRFQPHVGRNLAAAAENVVSILDVETQACRHKLQGHEGPVHSVCWDISGEFLASVSEDSVRVWTFGSAREGECVHELSRNGNKFNSCAFHPTYSSLLVIGCYQSLELWNMTENKTMTLSAHGGLIADLAVSTASGLVASASHDKFVKLWK